MSVFQSLDQEIIRTFKMHYRTYLVKHIIACCATAQTSDDIKITYLDAVYWIDSTNQVVTDATIPNIFDKAGPAIQNYSDTISSISDHSIINQLESQITDIYISSKSKRQAVLDDFFENNWRNE